ncbi:copper homeostasis protein CutC [Bifidobacterium sp. ESL0690]|uniref:copper homeostasis protein CutC n=1 Tax=Bifidobacterium sp. ESL0690 TaxID=2983214 RepID=UPI0023F6CEC6|nr:copper homeostasis protein CutC [Bifidobacterium sp. ESL0690]WEV46207.1 copper homeostasis protein CutC [Bifidobacterium sp. ESL0690]
MTGKQYGNEAESTGKRGRHRPVLEIAVQDLQGAHIAAHEGADRIEVCAALGATGGITPSYGTIRLCAQAGVRLGAEVLIRSRGGDFVFDRDEKVTQLAEIGSALEAGASGVVVGGLDRRGDIDLGFARDLIDEAHAQADRLGRRVDVVFHRAFDVARNQDDALETLISLGYTRVLTSGGARSAPAGAATIARLVEKADGRIQIMAGGGVYPKSMAKLSMTGVDALHLSARLQIHSAGGPGGGGASALVERTDPAMVRRSVEAVGTI